MLVPNYKWDWEQAHPPLSLLEAKGGAQHLQFVNKFTRKSRKYFKTVYI